MKIKKVEIEGFRAYKKKSDSTFDFTNDSDEAVNFVAIYAANGFGKSSFYDAVEWAITNRVKRLKKYQDEVKSTKNPDEGLKILRNKYVDEKTETTVVLSTSDQRIFERNIPRIRKNQNDMSLGESENDFFRRAILSQDEIEGFLREEKPQERYSKFMGSFGGDIETARKEISVLINDNQSELSSLNKECNLLAEELRQPIDLSVFKHFNSAATKLNTSGENIVLPDETISPQVVQQINAHLVSRQHELNTSLNINNKKLDFSTDRLNKIPEIKVYVGNEVENKTRLAWLLKGIADADAYRGLFNSNEQCAEDQKQANIRLKILIELAENSDYFLKIESRLKAIAKNEKGFSDECSKLNSELAGFQKNLDELDKELKIDDDRASLLSKSVERSDMAYTELSKNKIQRDALSQKIANKQIEIQKDKELQEKLSGELGELSKLKMTSSSLLVGNIGVLAFEQEKIERLSRCHAEFDLLRSHETTLKATQKSLIDQMDLHQKLIAMGLEYLGIEHPDTCPLCATPHLSADELIDKVKNQDLESELSRKNANQIIECSSRQKELSDEIEGFTRQAIEAQAHQLSSLRNKLNEVKLKFTKAEQEKADFEYELKKLESRSSELSQSVWGLSKQELLTRSEAELSKLSEKRLSLIRQQKDLAEKNQEAVESLRTKRVELSRLKSELDTKSSDQVYVSLLAYLNKNSITDQDIKVHFGVKRNELEFIVNEYMITCHSLVKQCHDLQKKMIADGTWVDVLHLKKEKEALEVFIANSHAAVNEFYESISNAFSIRTEEPLEQVQALIKIKAEECRVCAKELEELLSGIKLLLELINSFDPYIKHISTQKELKVLELKVEQRKQVDEVLVNERVFIIGKLEVLINSFFFEDLINSIYKKIDPHPTFKKVEFKVSFELDKPSLYILVSDDAGGMISPTLYFSTAQTNILSLSVFLANALHAEDDDENPIDVILIDDPIQSMDSINVLSTIDLLRSICLNFEKQIIISTHDENFFGLLQRKIPSKIFGSKFFQLRKFGVVSPVEPI
jgi:exonuclease SbcC